MLPTSETGADLSNWRSRPHNIQARAVGLNHLLFNAIRRMLLG